MSQPRIIVPGVTYLLTRRTLRRHFLFRPDAAMTRLIIYALAVSARRFDIHVHALCAMSTHLHLVVTDVRGVLPRFLQLFHRLVALGTKVLRCWEGPVWDHEPTSVVHLTTRQAVVERIAYVLANPVAAGLVRLSRDWPGAKVLVDELGRGEVRARRPEVYFDATNPHWSEVAALAITLPPSVTEVDADAFREDVRSELARQEASAHALGHGFLGAEGAARISPYDRATTAEPFGARNPTFAVGRNSGDAWLRAASAVRVFRASYRAALEAWCAGVRSVVFPRGTWWMHVLHGASVCARASSA